MYDMLPYYTLLANINIVYMRRIKYIIIIIISSNSKYFIFNRPILPFFKLYLCLSTNLIITLITVFNLILQQQ
nr:MAG TPA: hypothetical protein [Crassvirales sp.]